MNCHSFATFRGVVVKNFFSLIIYLSLEYLFIQSKSYEKYLLIFKGFTFITNYN